MIANSPVRSVAKSLVFSLWLMFPIAGHAELDFERMVVFGDSLTDSRNYFLDTRQFTVRPFPSIPDHPYVIGGLRFSNGKTWIEHLARDLDMGASGRPASARPTRFTNYAFGRSRARTVPDLWDLTEQVDLFLGHFDGQAPGGALYVLWIGANDLRDGLEALAADPSGNTTNAIVGAAIAAVHENIVRLYDAGATNFLVLNAPNLALIPAVRLQGPTAQFIAQGLSEGYNFSLEALLTALESTLVEIQILRFDTFGLFNDVADDPASAGFENVTDFCIMPGVILDAICDDPDAFLFWDAVHPTASAQEFFSGKVRAFLTHP